MSGQRIKLNFFHYLTLFDLLPRCFLDDSAYLSQLKGRFYDWLMIGNGKGVREKTW